MTVSANRYHYSAQYFRNSKIIKSSISQTFRKPPYTYQDFRYRIFLPSSSMRVSPPVPPYNERDYQVHPLATTILYGMSYLIQVLLQVDIEWWYSPMTLWLMWLLFHIQYLIVSIQNHHTCTLLLFYTWLLITQCISLTRVPFVMSKSTLLIVVFLVPLRKGSQSLSQRSSRLISTKSASL